MDNIFEEKKEKKKFPMGRKAALAAAGILIIAGVAYAGAAQKYRSVFFPSTLVNGVDAAGLTVDQTKEQIEKEIRDYSLTLHTRTGDETISGQDIGLHAEYDGSLERVLAEQNPYLWGIHLFWELDYRVDTMAVFDQEALGKVVDGLSCMDKKKMKDPVDASVSDYIDEVGYEIVPEQPGTRLDGRKVLAAVTNAVQGLDPELSLEGTGAYTEPKVTSSDKELLAKLDELNQYANMTIIYTFGDEKEILEGHEIHGWLIQDDQGNLSVDDEAIAAYVKTLAEKYDTADKSRELKTSYGDTVTIQKGTYGWKIDQKAETAALKEIILSGEGQTKEPVYQQTAAERSETRDYGDTYVEINLTAQHLYYYKDGKLLIDSDLVSGNMSRGMGTPAGAYSLMYKQRNATLRGPGYATPVSYWMPFNGGVGMHDATWRGSFGGAIYRTSGSHGCINLPSSVAKTIFENIEKGTPVLCYYMDGTSGTKTTSVASSGSSSSSSAPAAQPVQETQPAVPETIASIESLTQEMPIQPAVEAAVDDMAGAEQPQSSSSVIVAGAGNISSADQAGPGVSVQASEGQAASSYVPNDEGASADNNGGQNIEEGGGMPEAQEVPSAQDQPEANPGGDAPEAQAAPEDPQTGQESPAGGSSNQEQAPEAPAPDADALSIPSEKGEAVSGPPGM